MASAQPASYSIKSTFKMKVHLLSSDFTKSDKAFLNRSKKTNWRKNVLN